MKLKWESWVLDPYTGSCKAFAAVLGSRGLYFCFFVFTIICSPYKVASMLVYDYYRYRHCEKGSELLPTVPEFPSVLMQTLAVVAMSLSSRRWSSTPWELRRWMEWAWSRWTVTGFRLLPEVQPAKDQKNEVIIWFRHINLCEIVSRERDLKYVILILTCKKYYIFEIYLFYVVRQSHTKPAV